VNFHGLFVLDAVLNTFFLSDRLLQEAYIYGILFLKRGA